MKWILGVLMYLSASCAMAGAPLPTSADSEAPDSYFDRAGAPGIMAAVETNVAPVPFAAPAPEEAPEQNARQVIYSAAVRLVVLSAAEAIHSIQAQAEALGGYLQESDARSITVRVPVANFEDALAGIAKLGEVADRAVKASDVTEQMLDLNIRIDNARRTRERLLEHLAQSTKVEDTLKIEAELSRVSGEIEQMEGRIRFLQTQIAMSTIRVDLNSRTPPGETSANGLGLPFAWLDQLADGLVTGSVEGRPRRPSFFSSGPRFEPPQDFVRYYSSDDLVEAMDAEGVRIKLQRQANFDKGSLGFWQKLAHRSLVQTRSLALTEERLLDDQSALLLGYREVAGTVFGYCLVLSRTTDRVYTFEAWGPKPEFEAKLERLLVSARSLRR